MPEALTHPSTTRSGGGQPDTRSVAFQWTNGAVAELTAYTTDGSDLGSDFTYLILRELANQLNEQDELFSPGSTAKSAPDSTPGLVASTSTGTVEPLATIIVEPAIVDAGGEVYVSFTGSLATNRGGFFFLVSGSGEQVAGLWSDKFVEMGPGFTTDFHTFEILDFGVIEDSPDRLVLPPDLEPGHYQICTANSRPEACGNVEIR